jgi:hypothetical protein
MPYPLSTFEFPVVGTALKIVFNHRGFDVSSAERTPRYTEGVDQVPQGGFVEESE